MPTKPGSWVHRDKSGLADAVDFEHDLETGVFISLAAGCGDASRGVAEGKGTFAMYEGSKAGERGRLVGFTDFAGAYMWLDGAELRTIEHMSVIWGDQESVAEKSRRSGRIKKKRRTS